jgi:hypothetical protein
MSNAQVDRIYAKLGMRVAMIVSQAIIATMHKMHHVKHKLAMAVFHSISDEISDEVDVTLGPMLRMLHEETPEDHPAYPAIQFLHEATGQLKALAGAGLQMSGLLGTVSAIINNALAPQVYNIISQSPGQLPDVGTIVQAHAAQLIGTQEATGDLAGLGIQFGWADYMLTLGFTYPAFAEALELKRRGLATDDQVLEWAHLNGIPPEIAGKFLELETVPVSVADAALAVLRGNIDKAKGLAIAHENGYTPESFELLIGNTGEPPGLAQLLEGYRRGFIDKATLEKGILQSRYRNEWIPMLEQLRYVPMSVAEAVAASVQNQMPQDNARKIADENGLQPGHFDILYNTAGEPLSRTEMQQLYFRGEASLEQLKQAIRESRVKNKYVDAAAKLATREVPEDTIARALRQGSVSRADAVAHVMRLGFSRSDAEVIVGLGQGERVQQFKDRVMTATTGLFENGIISEQDASSAIQGIGYTADESKFIIQASKLRKRARGTEQAIAGIRSKYIGSHLTRQQASGNLDKTGIPATERDYLLGIWDLERGTVTRQLTEAQVIRLMKKTFLTPEDALSRLIALGYSEDDATLLVEAG